MSARARLLLACTAVCVVLAGGVRAEPGLAGTWRGAIVRLNAVQILDVKLHDGDGGLAGTYDIPGLALYDEPLREVARDDSTITFRILYGPFTLRIHDAYGELTGGNERWNPPLAMHLKKSAPDPAWYRTEDVTIDAGDAKLAATLFEPAGTGPFPAVVVIPGSGEQSRANWELRSHAYGLVRAGIACLVYDKRGAGGSTGSYDELTFPDLARDATTAIATLRKRSDIRHDAVGLVGVSQGGWIAAIAAHRDPRPDFVVFLEGPSRSLHDQELDRVRYQMTQDEFSTEAVDSAFTHTRSFFAVVNGTSSWESLRASTDAARASSWADYVQLPESADDPDLAWWRRSAYDPADDLRTLPVPALVLLGEFDPAVPPAENRLLWERYLDEAGVPHRIEIIPNLYHAVATYHTLEGGRWGWPRAFWVWSRRPPQLDAALTGWITATAETR